MTRCFLLAAAPFRAVLGCAAVAIALAAPAPSLARHHASGPPPTGLPGIVFDRVPPDVSFDTGDGARPLHTRFGRPLVINFWASWCGPCVAELGQLADARAKYGDRIAIVTISSEAPGVAAGFLASRGIVLPVVADPEKRVTHAYGVSNVPVTLILRPDGTLAHVSVGELDPGELAGALAVLLPDAPAAPAGEQALAP